MKILNIIETAYRATLEEQDDTIIWLSHALKGAGGEIDVLLQGNAVNYGVNAQDPSGLRVGACTQTQPPDIAGDVKGLIEKGCKVYVVQEDLDDRGINVTSSIEGLNYIERAALPQCFRQYEHIWHW